MKNFLIICSTLCLLLTGCGTSKVTNINIAENNKHPVKSLAMAPSGGLLADAVAVELSGMGFNVIDSSSTTSLMLRLNLSEIEITQPQGLAKLKAQGIDAVLSVKGTGSYDSQPQSASARVNSTFNGRVIAGVTWQNGFGGAAGSPADRVMRKGLNEAAREIAQALSKQLKTSE